MSEADDYILRSLSKITRKRWEHYVINRFYHRLDDPEIEFVCQQCIRKDDKRIYLADVFLPQLSLYLEVDEGHHDSDQGKIQDAIRRHDIVESTGFDEVRISVANVDLQDINKKVDALIERVRQRKDELKAEGNFPDWNYSRRFTAEPHLDAGSIEIGPHSAFWTHQQALRCFGYSKGHYQRSYWNIPLDRAGKMGFPDGCLVWFPRLYKQPLWDNSLSEDGCTITEISSAYPDRKVYSERWNTRIVMARSRDELNRTLYRFVGVFKAIPEYRDGNERRFRRIATQVMTCRPDVTD